MGESRPQSDGYGQRRLASDGGGLLSQSCCYHAGRGGNRTEFRDGARGLRGRFRQHALGLLLLPVTPRLYCLLTVLAAGPLGAQATGSIVGVVRDTAGAPIAGAKVDA